MLDSVLTSYSAVVILRDLFLVVGAVASDVLDVLREIQEAEARQAVALERMADAFEVHAEVRVTR
jgi:hypothetical protein